MLNRQIVVVVSVILRDKGGRVLLLKRSNKNKSNKGLWQLPEGKMEFGESCEDVIRREVSEETGLKLGKIVLFSVITFPMVIKRKRLHILKVIYKGLCKGRIRLGRDHADYGWFGSGDLKSLRTMTGTMDSLKGF